MTRLPIILFIFICTGIGITFFSSSISNSASILPGDSPHGSPFLNTSGYIVTAGFMDPAYKREFHEDHTGIDLVPSPPIKGNIILRSTISGTVSYYTTLCTGNAIIVSNDHYSIYYGHISSYLVPNGTLVFWGEPIATMGQSGTCATGAHVHYEIHEKVGNVVILVNPQAYLD